MSSAAQLTSQPPSQPIHHASWAFPALRAHPQALFLDGPGGTHTPECVINAISDYLATHNSNSGGLHPTSCETDAMVARTRTKAAAFLGAAGPTEVVFGANMTTLTFAISRAIARARFSAGDNVVVSNLDHEANISPWKAAAADHDTTVRAWAVEPADVSLNLERLEPLLDARTRLVAVTAASNLVGTRVEIPAVTAMVRKRAPQALVYVDAVHCAPHVPLDVQAWGSDFLVCSPYKFFGPHMGMLWGRQSLLESLQPYKVEPATDVAPSRWETGTPSFEAIAGLEACLDYLAELGGVAAIAAHERPLTQRFLRAVKEKPELADHVQLLGQTNPDAPDARTPTFAVRPRSPSVPVKELTRRLTGDGIYVWDGHCYALSLMRQLGLVDEGSVVRLGFNHYHGEGDVDRALDALARHCRP